MKEFKIFLGNFFYTRVINAFLDDGPVRSATVFLKILL
jgi:hypothetical protein